MSTKIGVDGLVYAIMTDEGSASAAPTYGAVHLAPGVMSVNVNPNPSQETLFADNGPMETASTLGKIEVEIQKNELGPADKSNLLGHPIDSKGGLVSGDSEVPPFVAVGFRSLKSNGTYRYVWLYKGKFMDPEDNNETKNDSINFQNDTISGQFVRIDKPYTVDGVTTKPWKYEMDEENVAADDDTMDAWFDSVVMPTDDGVVTNQTVTATVDSAATATGTLVVGVLGANLNGGVRVDVNVDVTSGDTVNEVAAKIRAAFVLNATLYAFFTINGTAAQISLTTITPAANDLTMAITLQDADSTGVAFAA